MRIDPNTQVLNANNPSANRTAPNTNSSASDQTKAPSTDAANISSNGTNRSRLDQALKNLNVSDPNQQSAESRIKDADAAKETMEQAKYLMLGQAGTTMLAQANMQPKDVMGLLR